MLDGVGIIVAAALLAVKFFRKGNDTLAASFLAPGANPRRPPSRRHQGQPAQAESLMAICPS